MRKYNNYDGLFVLCNYVTDGAYTILSSNGAVVCYPEYSVHDAIKSIPNEAMLSEEIRKDLADGRFIFCQSSKSFEDALRDSMYGGDLYQEVIPFLQAFLNAAGNDTNIDAQWLRRHSVMGELSISTR